MNLDYPPAAERFRQELRDFLAETLPPGWEGPGSLEGQAYLDALDQWRQALNGRGWRAPAWPKEYGGAGLSPLENVVLAEELARAGLPAEEEEDFGIDMIGNAIMSLGTDEQKARFLPATLSGEIRWCQGFSEPEAGSDLAAVRTRATRSDDGWLINGQKIWTSGAHHANWTFLLARSDPQSSRHRGLVFLLIPLEQPGIEVRPIVNVMGLPGFSEVFFNDASTDDVNVLGEPGEGWEVAMLVLSFERGAAALMASIRFEQELARLTRLVAERGRAADSVIRERLGWCAARVGAMKCLGWRSATKAIAGQPPGVESSIFKLFWSEYSQVQAQLAMDVLGRDALVAEGRCPQGTMDVTDQLGAPNSSASWQYLDLSLLSTTIYAGTSEIQRSIIGERVLGLPREPRPDRAA